MARSSGWVLCLVGSVATLAPVSTAVAVDEVRSVPLLLTAKQLERQGAEGSGFVWVEAKRYAELLAAWRAGWARQQRAAASVAPREAQPSAALLGAEVVAREAEDRLEVELTLVARVPGEGEQALPVSLARLAVASVEHQGPGRGMLVMAEGEDEAAAVFRGRGDHRLVVRGALPVHRSAGLASAELALPGLDVQRLRVEFRPGPFVLAPGAKLDRAPLALQEGPGGVHVLEGPCGRIKALSLAWSSTAAAARQALERRTAAPVEPPRLFSTNGSLVLVREAITVTLARLAVVNSGGPTTQLDLVVPAAATMKDVAGPLVLRAVRVAGQGGTLLRVLLKEPLKGGTEVTVTTEEAVPPEAWGTARTVRLSPPRVAGAVRQQVTVGVAALCPAALERGAVATGVVDLDPGDLPPEVAASSATPVIQAFGWQLREGEADPSVNVRVRPYRTERTLETTIDSTNAVTVITEAHREGAGGGAPRRVLTSMTRVVLQVVNASRKYLTVRLPADAKVTDCFVNFAACGPALGEPAEGEQAYLIPLLTSLQEGGRLLPYPVSITYARELGAALGDAGSLACNLPTFDAPVSDASWKVFTPEGHTFYEFGGQLVNALAPEEFVLIRAAEWLFNVLVGRVLLGGLCLVGVLLAGYVALAGVSGLRRLWAAVHLPGCGTVLFWGLVCLGLLGLLASISVPNFRRARERANQRACYANQKTIAGALEMYNLDNNTSIRRLGDDVLKQLMEKGYLQSLPTDPGLGLASVANYQLSPTGDIYCSCHGPIQECGEGHGAFVQAMAERATELRRSPAAGAAVGAANAHVAPVSFRIPRAGQFTLLLGSFVPPREAVGFTARHVSARSFRFALAGSLFLAVLLVLGFTWPGPSGLRRGAADALAAALVVVPSLLDDVDGTLALWFVLAAAAVLVARWGRTGAEAVSARVRASMARAAAPAAAAALVLAAAVAPGVARAAGALDYHPRLLLIEGARSPVADAVLLPQDEYERLLEPPAPPADAVTAPLAVGGFTEASCDVRLGASAAEVVLRARLRVVAEPDEPVTLLEELGTASLARVTVDGVELPLSVGEGGAVAVRGLPRGESSVEVRLAVVPGAEGRYGHGLRVPVIRAPACRLSVTPPAGAASWSVSEARGAQAGAPCGLLWAGPGGTLEGVHRPVAALRLGWQTPDAAVASAEPREAPAEREPQLSWRFVHYVRVRDAEWRDRGVLDVTVEQAPVAEASFLLPAGVNVLDLQGAAVREWYTTPAGADRRVVLRLAGETQAPFRVQFELHGDARGRALVALPFAPEAYQETHQVALDSDSHLELEVQGASQSLRPLDVSHFPLADVGLARGALHSCYQSTRFPRYEPAAAREALSLRLGIVRHEKAVVWTAAADLEEATTVVTREGHAVTRVRWLVKNNSEQFLRVALPAEAGEVLTTFVSGRAVTPARDEAGGLLVPLERSLVRSTQAAAFEVELTYLRRGLPAPVATGRLALDLPRVNLTVSTLRWTVNLPKGYQLQPDGGTVRYDPAPRPVDYEGEADGGVDRAATRLVDATTLPLRIQLAETGSAAYLSADLVRPDDEAPALRGAVVPTTVDRGAKKAVFGAACLLAVLLLGRVEARRRRAVAGAVLVVACGAAVGVLSNVQDYLGLGLYGALGGFFGTAAALAGLALAAAAERPAVSAR